MITRHRDLNFHSKLGTMRVAFDFRIGLVVPGGFSAYGETLKMM